MSWGLPIWTIYFKRGRPLIFPEQSFKTLLHMAILLLLVSWYNKIPHQSGSYNPPLSKSIKQIVRSPAELISPFPTSKMGENLKLPAICLSVPLLESIPPTWHQQTAGPQQNPNGPKITRGERSYLFVRYLGVSKNRGTPKWMVYNGKPY